MARAALFLACRTPNAPNFCKACAARRASAETGAKAKAEPNGAGVPRLGVVAIVNPVRLRFSLCCVPICPQQALASVHTAAPAPCTCTRNRAGWSVCAVARTMSVGCGGPARVCGSLGPAQRVSTAHVAGGANAGGCMLKLAPRMAPRAACCQWNSSCGRRRCFWEQ